MPKNKNKNKKEYSTSYEKKISINPMTEAFSMGEDESPTIGGAIGMATKRVGELTPSGRAITAMRKNPKTSSGVAGVLGGTGVGYAAGRYDGENYTSEENAREGAMEPPTESLADLVRGIQAQEEFKKRQSQEAAPMKKGGKVKMHKMPGGKMMKDSDMKKKKKMGGGMMQDSMGYKKGGTVRGGRSEIKGTRPAKLY